MLKKKANKTAAKKPVKPPAKKAAKKAAKTPVAKKVKPKTPTEARRNGRPTLYTEALADKICDALATCTDGLEVICKRTKGFPSHGSIYTWMWRYPGFLEKYARAREAQAQLSADQIQMIADTQEIGHKVTIKGDGTKETVIADMIEHRKLRIEARKWNAMKLLPKRYSDKVDHNVAGGVEVTIRNLVGDVK